MHRRDEDRRARPGSLKKTKAVHGLVRVYLLHSSSFIIELEENASDCGIKAKEAN